MPSSAILWFRRDLRLADNPALTRALELAETIAPVCVIGDPSAPHAPGSASRAWLAASLGELASAIEARGGTLAVRESPAVEALAAAAAECGARVVACSRDWAPGALAEERAVAERLAADGVELIAVEGQLLVAPDALAGAGGKAYQVFTPYLKQWRGRWHASAPAPAPERLPAPPRALDAAATREALARLRAEARPDALQLGEWWQPGEAGAARRLAAFADGGALAAYPDAHDLPATHGTSELSPHLAHGEISANAVAHAVLRAAEASGSPADAEPYLRQLAWRDFAYHVLYANPRALDEPLHAEFSAMAWRDDPAALAAWREGCTGYPLVDAGMRQLAASGWMHNRVRMVAASLLTKDLLVRWQDGERVFAELLADYDPVLNAFNWQWVAGSGADAAPYFRIFNPSLQGTRFDELGAYMKRWVPELAEMPARWVHRPWAAPSDVLAEAGVRLCEEYPRPLVEHAEARERALAAYSAVRDARRATASTS